MSGAGRMTVRRTSVLACCLAGAGHRPGGARPDGGVRGGRRVARRADLGRRHPRRVELRAGVGGGDHRQRVRPDAAPRGAAADAVRPRRALRAGVGRRPLRERQGRGHRPRRPAARTVGLHRRLRGGGLPQLRGARGAGSTPAATSGWSTRPATSSTRWTSRAACSWSWARRGSRAAAATPSTCPQTSASDPTGRSTSATATATPGS